MSQLSTHRKSRWLLLAAPVAGALILAGCSGSADTGGGGGDATDAPAEGVGFSIMVAQANDADDYYAKMAEAYTAETGVEIEMIPYPSDAYNTQVTTQLQAGNAADMMVLAPGTGQAISVVTLAEAGFLEPLDEASAGVIPEGTENLYEVDGEIYGQPTALAPVGLIYNGAGGEEVGIEAYPETFDELLEACTTARDGGKTFTVLAGAIPFNTGLFAMLVSATRVYQADPDWNEQRAAGDVTFVGSGWEDALNDVIALNEGGCFHHPGHRRRHLADRGRPRVGGDLDRSRHRSGPHRPGVPAGGWPGAVHAGLGQLRVGRQRLVRG
jgi:raffinose/stachyose/melibiose transport system substrate-binding protein